jgi:hypothetical protein
MASILIRDGFTQSYRKVTTPEIISVSKNIKQRQDNFTEYSPFYSTEKGTKKYKKPSKNFVSLR